ncbi:hypothetical protein ACLKA7_016968 [Drosophila subpalustris]
MLLRADPNFRSNIRQQHLEEKQEEGQEERQERVTKWGMAMATALAVFLFVRRQILNLFYCSLVLVRREWCEGEEVPWTPYCYNTFHTQAATWGRDIDGDGDGD